MLTSTKSIVNKRLVMQEIVAAPNIEEKEVMSPKGKDPRR